MAIEDAGTLGALFPLGTSKDHIPQRLKAFELLRKERAEYVKMESLEQARDPDKRGFFFKCKQYLHETDSRQLLTSIVAPELMDLVLGHDAVAQAQIYLREHEAA